MPQYIDDKGRPVRAQRLGAGSIPVGLHFDAIGPHIMSPLGRMSALQGDWVVTDERQVQRVYDASEFERLFTLSS